MSNEQITQETVPVEKTQPSTETVKPITQETTTRSNNIYNTINMERFY